MSAVGPVTPRVSTATLKDTLGAALRAHAQVPAGSMAGSVQVSEAVWAQIAAALGDAQALHDLDLSTVRVSNRISIEGEPRRDQLIEVFVPVGQGSVQGVTGDVKPDQKGGPDARVSWSSIGSVSTALARTFALGIVRAADLVDEGMAQKLEEAPAANPPRKARRVARHESKEGDIHEL